MSIIFLASRISGITRVTRIARRRHSAKLSAVKIGTKALKLRRINILAHTIRITPALPHRGIATRQLIGAPLCAQVITVCLVYTVLRARTGVARRRQLAACAVVKVLAGAGLGGRVPSARVFAGVCLTGVN